MTFSTLMLVVSVWAFFVALRMNSLESDSGLFGSDWFVVAVLVGVCAFAILTAAHFVTLILRFTIWSDA